MSFLYPLFLFAGLAIAIPILIHLFNLRRYKTVYFPNTRFLKNIQLHSQKQSQIKYKWLLALRILFLLALILAFAQPFFAKKNQTDASNRLQVIYIDNSQSMSLKKGARNLLDLAKEAARAQLQQAGHENEFLLLTNDKPVSYQPMSAEKTLSAINNISISSAAKSPEQIFTFTQGITESEALNGANVYYYSDFQKNNFPAQADKTALNNIRFFGVPIRMNALQNVFIDTAFLTSPVLQSGQPNQIIVKNKLIGKEPSASSVLQLSINGQVKTAATLDFNEKIESIDTLSFQVNDAGWQRIILTVNDAAVRFDDTFRIAARSASNLSVLVLNEDQPNPFIQAAFRAYDGFRMDQKNLNENADWKQYNLIILNDITSINDALSKQIINALQQGQSICIFPGRTQNISSLNEGLNKIAAIRITGIDTAVETATSLQQGSDLVKDLFEKIPDNVQLPTANWHYNISASLSANQQSILSFRNGDPLLAQFSPSKGKLYLSATSANLQSGNFPGSYFFAPFLYQMTAQSKGSDVYAITAGKPQPIFLSLSNANERNMVHAYGDDIDVIPPQRPNGAGLDIFLGQTIQQPGFYTLAATGSDSTVVAMNQDRAESQLELWDMDQLKENWKGDNIKWLQENSMSNDTTFNKGNSFPLWKVCIILALLMLAAETYLLARGYRKSIVATS